MELKKYGERKVKHSNPVAFEEQWNLVLGSMTWNGTGKLEFIDGIMGSEVYVNILNKNILASTQKLRMWNYFIFQQDTDLGVIIKESKIIFIQKHDWISWMANSKSRPQSNWTSLSYSGSKSCLTMSQNERRAEDLAPRSLD